MKRSRALLWVAVLVVGVAAGCGSAPKVSDTVQVQVLQPEGAKFAVYDKERREWAPPLTIPDFRNLAGGATFNVRLTDIPGQAGVTLWGRLTVSDVTDYTIDCAVPLEITRDDVEDARRNVLVVKVVFLPDEKHQVYAIPGAPTSIVSTRLEPGKDPVEEAKKQGKVLLVLRLGGRQQGM